MSVAVTEDTTTSPIAKEAKEAVLVKVKCGGTTAGYSCWAVSGSLYQTGSSSSGINLSSKFLSFPLVSDALLLYYCNLKQSCVQGACSIHNSLVSLVNKCSVPNAPLEEKLRLLAEVEASLTF